MRPWPKKRFSNKAMHAFIPALIADTNVDVNVPVPVASIGRHHPALHGHLRPILANNRPLQGANAPETACLVVTFKAGDFSPFLTHGLPAFIAAYCEQNRATWQ